MSRKKTDKIKIVKKVLKKVMRDDGRISLEHFDYIAKLIKNRNIPSQEDEKNGIDGEAFYDISAIYRCETKQVTFFSEKEIDWLLSTS